MILNKQMLREIACGESAVDQLRSEMISALNKVFDLYEMQTRTLRIVLTKQDTMDETGESDDGS